MLSYLRGYAAERPFYDPVKLFLAQLHPSLPLQFLRPMLDIAVAYGYVGVDRRCFDGLIIPEVKRCRVHGFVRIEPN